MIWLWVLVTIFVIQFACAAIALRFRTDKLTDLAYGGTFFLVARGMYLRGSEQLMVHTILVILLSIWSIRLALYLFLRVVALGTDKRFDGIRENKRVFSKFRLLQTIVIFLLFVPIVRAMQDSEIAVRRYALLGVALVMGGIVVETIADRQKFRFKQQFPTRWCNVGLWSKLQYPNYAGEIAVWIGFYLICLVSLEGYQVFFAAVSPFTISRLLLFVTGIPPLEKAHEKQRGTDKQRRTYTQKTPKIIPGIY